MIRIRLFTAEEWRDAVSIDPDKEHRYRMRHMEHSLRDLLNCDPGKNPAIPFRDAASLQFLKESYGITFASDDDWFSIVRRDGRRSDITCLGRGVLFGLAAIELSSHGTYVELWDPVCEEVSRALAYLPYDILMGVLIREMDICQLEIKGTDYLIENYPYKGRTIEVTVKDGFLDRDDFYTPVPECFERNTNYGLYMGRDGRYYSSRFSIYYAFQYDWKNAVEGLLREIDRIYEDRIPLMDSARSFNIFEFGELVHQDRNCIMLLEYPERRDCLDRSYQEGKLSEAEHKKYLRELEESPEYEEYLYFRDKFKVICHIAFSPKKIKQRRLPMLMVDQNRDGTWLIHEDLTVKNPGFYELFYDVIKGRSAERERFILIVDAEERLCSAEDIKDAVCGFRVREDSVDVYGAYEGAVLFGRALREAYHSEFI